MSHRTIILSDLHLGRAHGAATSADALRPVWLGADRLVINGDVAEIHHPRHRAAAARKTLRLFDLCEEDGVELTLLSGNHDPFISDIRHLHMADGLILVTHGDVLHPAVAPWSPVAGRVRKASHRALATLTPDEREDLETRLRASQYASAFGWADLAKLENESGRSNLFGMLIRPWAPIQVLLYWHVVPSLAAAFAERHAPDARYLVLGHTHHPGVWRIGPRVILNTGSFGFPGRPRAVIVDDGELSFVRILRRNGSYRLEDRPLTTWTIPATIASRAS